VSAERLELALDGDGGNDLPDGFVIEERLDPRENPAPIVFDLFHRGKRVAWTLRSRDAAIRWAWRIAGVPLGAQVSFPMRRRPAPALWWIQAS
jgi:hypothetical protein